MKKIILALSIILFASLSPVLAQEFTDIADHPYREHIEALAENNLVSGYQDGSYRPGQTISRAEFTKILLLAKYSPQAIDECTAADFSDVDQDAWYRSYVCFAKENGIIKGYADGTFGPNREITFAEAAKIVVNTLIELTEEREGKDWWIPFVEKMNATGATPASVTAEDQQLTRGEMAHIIATIKAEEWDFDTPAKEPESDAPVNDDEEDNDEEEPSDPVTEVDEPAADLPLSKDDPAYVDFSSDTLGLSFRHREMIETKEGELPAKILETSNQAILATRTEAFADETECEEDRFCTVQDSIMYSHQDGFYLLSKLNGDTDFIASIERKLEAQDVNLNDCTIETKEENGWTEARVKVANPRKFTVNEEGKAIDNDGNELSKYEQNRLLEEEAVTMCSSYAGGYGKSFFLFDSEKSDRFFLYVPSYGSEERLIDYSSVEFE